VETAGGPPPLNRAWKHALPALPRKWSCFIGP